MFSANEVMNSGCELNWIRPASGPVPLVGVVQIPRSSPRVFWKLVRLLEMAHALFLARNMFCASWYASDVTSVLKTPASIICFTQPSHPEYFGSV